MSYVQNSLSTGEKIVYTAKLHWIIFFWPAIFVLLAISSNKTPSLLGFFLLLSVVTGLVAAINFATSYFAITTKRVVI